MEYYIDDMFDFLMAAADAELVVQEYNQRANWLADEELDLE